MEIQRFREQIRLVNANNTVEIAALSFSNAAGAALVIGDSSELTNLPSILSLGTASDLFAKRGAANCLYLGSTATGFDAVASIGDATHRLNSVYAQVLNIANGKANLANTGLFSAYGNIATAGFGVPAIYAAPAISATKAANFTVLTFVPAAAAGVYEVAAVITTTSGTNTGTMQATLDYVDSQGTTHTADVIPLIDAAGSSATTKTGASKEFHTPPWTFTVDNSQGNVVLKVVITGTVAYTVTGTIKQVI